jgi:hypothetical protein
MTPPELPKTKVTMTVLTGLPCDRNRNDIPDLPTTFEIGNPRDSAFFSDSFLGRHAEFS